MSNVTLKYRPVAVLRNAKSFPYLNHGSLRLRDYVDHRDVLCRDEDAAGHVEGLDDVRRPNVVEYQQRSGKA